MNMRHITFLHPCLKIVEVQFFFFFANMSLLKAGRANSWKKYEEVQCCLYCSISPFLSLAPRKPLALEGSPAVMLSLSFTQL